MSVLSCADVSKVFQDNGYEALNRVSVEIGEGEAVGIVGESGSGKSTLGNIIGGLEKPTGGTVFYHGTDISGLKGEALRSFRRSVQYIFQDPKGAMNPYFTLRRVLMEPLQINFPGIGKSDCRSDQRTACSGEVCDCERGGSFRLLCQQAGYRGVSQF